MVTRVNALIMNANALFFVNFMHYACVNEEEKAKQKQTVSITYYRKKPGNIQTPQKREEKK